MLRLRLALALALAIGLLASPSLASAAPADQCPPGQNPKYVFGFATLSSLLQDQMGQPVTCEFADPNGTGDVHQQTTKGLAFWRKSTNTPTFTNGYDHWALTPQGGVHWVGGSIDPPSQSPVAAPPAQRPVPTPPPPASAAPADPKLRSLALDVVADANAFWARTQRGYTPVKLTWYRSGAVTGCGRAGADGPFYCGADRTVYVDTPFVEHLWQQGMDFGVATVLAHEVGHHVQSSVGLRVVPVPSRPGQVFSIDLELGADCLAGVWAADANQRHKLNAGAIDQALDIAYASGDPTGTPWYDPQAHGSSTQRAGAFAVGFLDHSPQECFAL